MRKAICFVLVFVVVLTLPITALASTSYMYSDITVHVLSPDTFYEIFNASRVDAINYDYSFILNSTEDSAIACVYFELSIHDIAYTGHAIGTVNAYQTYSELLWEGPLYGTIEIDNTELPISVGFAKLGTSSNVQLSISIEFDISGSKQYVLLGAGGNVLYPEIFDLKSCDDISVMESSKFHDVESYSTNGGIVGDTPIIKDDGGTANYDGYVLQIYKSVLGGSGSKAQIAGTSVYFRNTTNTVAICLHSYCDNVSSIYESSNTAVSTSVSQVSYQLTRDGVEDSGYSYIAGIELFDFPTSNIGKSNSLLLALFEDVLSIFDVPSSTISTIFSSARGKVSIDDSSDTSTVQIVFPVSNRPDFDDLERGLPIVFQLQKGTSLYKGDSPYTVTTEIEYHTIISYPYTTDVYTYSVYSTETIQASIEVTLL